MSRRFDGSVERGAPWHLEDLARLRPAAATGDWLRVALSGLLGGLSHIFLDGFTHGTHSGWAVPLIPILYTPIPSPSGAVPLHDVLHVFLTITLGAFGLRQAARIGRTRLIAAWYPQRESAAREAMPFEKWGAAGYFAACALIGIGAGIGRSHAHLEWVELGAFGAIAFTVYGLLLASVTDWLRTTWSGRKEGLKASEAGS